MRKLTRRKIFYRPARNPFIRGLSAPFAPSRINLAGSAKKPTSPHSDAEAEKASTWRKEPDQSYEAQIGNYVQHVYGETEYGGTQVLKLSAVAFEKVGMPALPPRSSASTSETIQHTLYQGMIMPIAVLGAMTWAARRNVRKDDDDSAGGES